MCVCVVLRFYNHLLYVALVSAHKNTGNTCISRRWEKNVMKPDFL